MRKQLLPRALFIHFCRAQIMLIIALLAVLTITSCAHLRRVEARCGDAMVANIDAAAVTTITQAFLEERWLEAVAAAIEKIGPVAVCIIEALAADTPATEDTRLGAARAAAYSSERYRLVQARAARYLATPAR